MSLTAADIGVAADVAGRAAAVRLGAERDRLEHSLARLAGAIIPRTSAALDAAHRLVRRHGNAITRRVGVVRNDGLDRCLR